MKKTRLALTLAAAALVTSVLSCEKGKEIDSFTYDFVTVYTDANGYGSVLKNDRGGTYVIADTSIHMKPDTLFRMICSYTVNADSTTAHVFSAAQTIAIEPVNPEEFHNTVVDHPVKIQSAWLGGGYLNIIFDILALDKVHRLFPLEYSDSTYTNVRIGLYHDENGDERGFTRHAYMSIPLSKYGLQSGDTVTFFYKGYNGPEEKKFVKR